MDLNRIRNNSIEAASHLGISALPTLPLLDAGLERRDAKQAVSRLLAMHVIAAVAFGFDRVRATSWLIREALADSLTDQEKEFLFEGRVPPERFKSQIEGMWALAWALGIVKELNFAKDCDNRFVLLLPNLKENQITTEFRKRVEPRPLHEDVAALDLAYCLHWVMRQCELDGKPPPAGLKPQVIVERRRALEWILAKEEWDTITLDT